MDSVKGIILQNGVFLLAEIEELFTEPGQPDCRLINPFIVDGEEVRKWVAFTDQNFLLINSSNILSIVEKISPEYIKKYVDLL